MMGRGEYYYGMKRRIEYNLAVMTRGDISVFDKVSMKPQIQVSKQGNSIPLKVLMQSSFTSQQLVFLAGTLKPKGFVPCILAMSEECMLGQCVWH